MTGGYDDRRFVEQLGDWFKALAATALVLLLISLIFMWVSL